MPTQPLKWNDIINASGHSESDDTQAGENIESSENNCDFTYSLQISSEPHLIQQNELNDLVRDLGLSKQQTELLGSRLQEWNLLVHGTNVTSFRRKNCFFSVLKIEGPFCIF